MTSILDKIKNEKSYMTDLRRHFHQYPEPSLEEFKTAEKIEAELCSMDIPYKRVGETGVLGIIKGKKSELNKIIILRADIDALRIQEENDLPYRSKNDGLMHACAHDAHTASLLGAAKVLMQYRDSISGEIRLVFQQAEEYGAGARKFIDAGVLEGAGRVFAIHMVPDMDVGKIDITSGPRNASTDNFIIKVKGKSSHVATPHKGVDALYTACQIVNALQGLVARRVSPLESVIIGVGKLHSGTAYNIIADEALMEGTLRTYQNLIRDELKERIDNLSAHVAAASGAERDISWFDFAPVLENDELVCEELVEIAAKIAGSEGVVRDRSRSLGGDDFADFLVAVPGAYVNIGCANPGKLQIPLHNCCFNINEDSLIYAAAMYAEYALWFLKE